MATKKEIFASTLGAVMAFCEDNNVSGKVTKGLESILTENLAPKTGGASINLDEVTVKDDEGNVVEIMCAASGVFLPATPEYFYEEKDETKGINGLKRHSRQAEQIKKSFTKQNKASQAAIMDDILEADVSTPEGQELVATLKDQLADVKAEKVDYAGVTA